MASFETHLDEVRQRYPDLDPEAQARLAELEMHKATRRPNGGVPQRSKKVRSPCPDSGDGDDGGPRSRSRAYRARLAEQLAETRAMAAAIREEFQRDADRRARIAATEARMRKLEAEARAQAEKERQEAERRRAEEEDARRRAEAEAEEAHRRAEEEARAREEAEARARAEAALRAAEAVATMSPSNGVPHGLTKLTGISADPRWRQAIVRALYRRFGGRYVSKSDCFTSLREEFGWGEAVPGNAIGRVLYALDEGKEYGLIIRWEDFFYQLTERAIALAEEE